MSDGTLVGEYVIAPVTPLGLTPQSEGESVDNVQTQELVEGGSCESVEREESLAIEEVEASDLEEGKDKTKDGSVEESVGQELMLQSII